MPPRHPDNGHLPIPRPYLWKPLGWLLFITHTHTTFQSCRCLFLLVMWQCSDLDLSDPHWGLKVLPSEKLSAPSSYVSNSLMELFSHTPHIHDPTGLHTHTHTHLLGSWLLTYFQSNSYLVSTPKALDGFHSYHTHAHTPTHTFLRAGRCLLGGCDLWPSLQPQSGTNCTSVYTFPVTDPLTNQLLWVANFSPQRHNFTTSKKPVMQYLLLTKGDRELPSPGTSTPSFSLYDEHEYFKGFKIFDIFPILHCECFFWKCARMFQYVMPLPGREFSQYYTLLMSHLAHDGGN